MEVNDNELCKWQSQCIQEMENMRNIDDMKRYKRWISSSKHYLLLINVNYSLCFLVPSNYRRAVRVHFRNELIIYYLLRADA